MTDTLPAIPAVGSVLHMIPARRRARAYLRKRASGERWSLRIIGWATVVSCIREEDVDWSGGGEYETAIEPIVLVEGQFLVRLRDHLAYDLDGCEIVKVRP